jgi:hypothetical protein
VSPVPAAPAAAAEVTKPVALLIGAVARKHDVLIARALERARALGLDARDYTSEYSRWGGSSLFYGEVGEPPRWVAEPVAATWRKEGAVCPTMPQRSSPSVSDPAADAAYACTQKLLLKLREIDLERQRPDVIFEVQVDEEQNLSRSTGRWFAVAWAGRPNDPCGRSLGAGARSPILVPLRDADTPKTEDCAIDTALALAERLLRGEAGTTTSRRGVSLRVIAPSCPSEQHVDVAEREQAKTPQRVCAP